MKHLDALPAVLCCLTLWALHAAQSHAQPSGRPVVVTTIEEPAAYVAEPLYAIYHRAGCFYVNERHDLLKWQTEHAARDTGRHPCEHCLRQRLAQAR